MHAVEAGEAAHEGNEDDEEDDAELEHVVQHAAEGHEERAELLTRWQQVGQAGEARDMDGLVTGVMASGSGSNSINDNDD